MVKIVLKHGESLQIVSEPEQHAGVDLQALVREVAELRSTVQFLQKKVKKLENQQKQSKSSVNLLHERLKKCRHLLDDDDDDSYDRDCAIQFYERDNCAAALADDVEDDFAEAEDEDEEENTVTLADCDKLYSMLFWLKMT